MAYELYENFHHTKITRYTVIASICTDWITFQWQGHCYQGGGKWTRAWSAGQPTEGGPP